MTKSGQGKQQNTKKLHPKNLPPVVDPFAGQVPPAAPRRKRRLLTNPFFIVPLVFACLSLTACGVTAYGTYAYVLYERGELSFSIPFLGSDQDNSVVGESESTAPDVPRANNSPFPSAGPRNSLDAGPRQNTFQQRIRQPDGCSQTMVEFYVPCEPVLFVQDPHVGELWIYE